jgi:serine/threonine-protein kinase RIM15
VEVKAHPFLADMDWANWSKSEASFVPSVIDPESTDYFDPCGATQVFHDEEDPPAHPDNDNSGGQSCVGPPIQEPRLPPFFYA